MADGGALEDLARESLATAEEVFGPDHGVTITNLVNYLLARQERTDVDETDLAALARDYEATAMRPSVHRSGQLVDVLLNLATVTERRSDIGRGDRLELMLAVLEDALHVARLTRADDIRTRVFCLANQAAVLRQRVAGSRRANAEQALARLAEAHALDAEHQVLFDVERIQLAINRLNALVTCVELGVGGTRAEDLPAAAEEVAALAESVHDQHEMALKAVAGAGAALVSLYRRTLTAGHADRVLWTAAEPLLRRASSRADVAYPRGAATRLTARLNLAALLGMAVDGQVADAETSARLLLEVADEAAGRSPEHEATAWANLAHLRLGQGRWDDAGECFARARLTRRAMVRQSTTRHTRLGEVVATGELAALEALTHVHQQRLDQAVAALEEGRATLLRDRRPVPAALPPVPGEPGRTVVYLAMCAIGTFGVVRSGDQPDRGFLTPLGGRSFSQELRGLVSAPDRIRRMLALRRIQRVLDDLADTVTVLAGDQTQDLCVVACGPLAGAPLHAARDRSGLTWLDRWTVRYWASAAVAAHLHPPDLTGHPSAVAIASDEADLPLARVELDAVARRAPRVRTPPPAWSAAAWLRGALQAADIAHFACHARSDLLDPTASSFDFGPSGRLTVADVLDWDDVHDVDLVVASACQAGAPAEDAPDEFLGIGFGLLHAGARSVVSPLWEVNDTPTAILMTRFYQELSHTSDPAQALRVAQTWLRNVDNTGLLAWSGDADRERGDADDGKPRGVPAALAVHLARRLRDADPAEQPFRHPVDWAAFTYLGA